MGKSMFRRSILAGCWLGLALSAAPVRGGILFTQPPTVGDGPFNTYTSAYTNSSGGYYQTFDNFELASNSVVTGISWQGDYLGYNSATKDYVNASPNTLAWDFVIYNSKFQAVAIEVVLGSNVTQTLGGTFNYNNTSGDVSSINYYDESAQLPSGILLQGGQPYYLAIFSDSTNDSSSDFFSWLSGSGGDGVSYQFSTFSDSNSTVPLDRTFTLSGTVVPEPSGLILAGLGLACLAGYSRRARRAARAGRRRLSQPAG